MILKSSRVSYSRKIMLNHSQLIIQTILIVVTASIISFGYFFIFGVDASINQHEDGVERTLILNKVVLSDETYEQLIEDIQAIPDVESTSMQITDSDQILSIKLKDYRLRQTVIDQLPSYIVSAGIMYHQFEAFSKQIVTFKIAGILAVGIMVIVYIIFYFGIISHIGKCYEKANDLLFILGYNIKSRFKMSLLPFFESSFFAGIIFFILIKFVVMPPINSLINEVNQLSRFGIKFQISFVEVIGMIFISIIFTGFNLFMSMRKKQLVIQRI